MSELSTIEIINSLAVLILAALIAWARYRERKLTDKYKLGPNPERCARHEERLNQIEGDVREIRNDCHRFDRCLTEIKERLARLEAKL